MMLKMTNREPLNILESQVSRISEWRAGKSSWKRQQEKDRKEGDQLNDEPFLASSCFLFLFLSLSLCFSPSLSTSHPRWTSLPSEFCDHKDSGS